MCITYGGDEHGNGQYSKPYPSERGKIQEDKKSIFYESIENTIRFYGAWGKENCKEYATSWCIKNCYMKTQPFEKTINDEIQNIKLEDYHDNKSKILQDLADCIKTEKYVTFFASGCFEKMRGEFNEYSIMYNIWKLGKLIEKKGKNIKIRFFLRDSSVITKGGPFVKEVYDINPNSILILSVDRDTKQDIIEKGLKNHKINGIAVIDHNDNQKLIYELTHRIIKDIKDVIVCKYCNGKMLCFNHYRRFILIQEYKGVKILKGQY